MYSTKTRIFMEKYSAENIRTISTIEHIRLRPGMFIGRTNIQGFTELLKSFTPYIFDKLQGDSFQLTLEDDLKGQIILSNLKDVIPHQIASAIWVPGSHGMGDPIILNALSLEFESLFFLNDELIHSKSFKKGIQTEGETETPNGEMTVDKWIINFKLDREMWSELEEWNYHFISEALKNHAFLNKGKSFSIRYPSGKIPCHIHYHFENGLKAQLELMQLNGLGNSFFDTYVEKELNGFSVDVAFAFRNYSVDSSIIQSYVNYHHTIEDGTHVQGLLKGLTYGVMKYFQKQGFTTEYKISQKGIKENLIALIHVKMDAPVFSGCVKNKLANPEIIQPIKEWISDILFEQMENDTETTALLIRKFEV